MVAHLVGRAGLGVEYRRYGLIVGSELALGLFAVLLRQEVAAPPRQRAGGVGHLLHLGADDAAAGSDVLLAGEHSRFYHHQLLEHRTHPRIQPRHLQIRIPVLVNPEESPGNTGQKLTHLESLVAGQLVRRPVVLVFAQEIFNNPQRRHQIVVRGACSVARADNVRQ